MNEKLLPEITESHVRFIYDTIEGRKREKVNNRECLHDSWFQEFAKEGRSVFHPELNIHPLRRWMNSAMAELKKECGIEPYGLDIKTLYSITLPGMFHIDELRKYPIPIIRELVYIVKLENFSYWIGTNGLFMYYKNYRLDSSYMEGVLMDNDSHGWKDRKGLDGVTTNIPFVIPALLLLQKFKQGYIRVEWLEGILEIEALTTKEEIGYRRKSNDVSPLTSPIVLRANDRVLADIPKELYKVLGVTVNEDIKSCSVPHKDPQWTINLNAVLEEEEDFPEDDDDE